MFNVRPIAFSPWLHVEPPPPDEPPGFRVAADGSVRETQSEAFAPFGYDPRGTTPLAGAGFEDAIRLVPGGSYPEAYPTYGTPGLAPLPTDPIQEALDQIARIYGGFGAKPSIPLDRQDPGTRPDVLTGGPLLSPNASWPMFPQAGEPAAPIEPVRYVKSEGTPLAEGQFSSLRGKFAPLAPRFASPPESESSPGSPNSGNPLATSRTLSLLPTDGATGEPTSGPSRSADQNIVRIADGDSAAASGGEVLIAQQDNKVTEPTARRGIAPNVELPPGTPLKDGPGQPVILPDGARIPDRYSKTGHLMSPVADLTDVAAAGRETAKIYRLLRSSPEHFEGALWQYIGSFGAHVGHGGLFDYQRGPGNSITGFEPRQQFRNVSNVNVGLFSQQAGLTLDQVLRNAGEFARLKSNNAKPREPYGLDPQTREFIELGYKIGESGLFGPAEAP